MASKKKLWQFNQWLPVATLFGLLAWERNWKTEKEKEKKTDVEKKNAFQITKFKKGTFLFT